MKGLKLFSVALAATFFYANTSLVSAATISASMTTDVKLELNTDSDSKTITYSGIIVDCRGLGLKTSASPIIKNESGKIIYGDKDLDFDKINEIGMAEYTTTIQDSTPRAGKNPLIVRAVKLDKFNTSPILSNKDAERVLTANKVSSFFNDLKVVFLTD